MKYKIVVDSSSDLTNDYIKDENVGFEVVPLTINVDGKDFVDNDSLSIDELLTAMKASTTKATSSCPSCGYFSSSYEQAENVICITMTSKLSGTYNAAYLGSNDLTSKVHVVDSKATSGTMRLLVDKAYELMKKDLDFDTICEQLEKYRDSLNLFFVLDKFDNLVKNGRMSKVTAFIANALYIKPLCMAKDGVIDVYEKPRTMKGALNKLVESIEKQCTSTEGRTCIISHCKNNEDALYLKEKIQGRYQFKDVVITEMKGLCSFYALEKGLIVSF
jgi:DegV family protein with EDD domain